jgi:hypothetical protein
VRAGEFETERLNQLALGRVVFGEFAGACGCRLGVRRGRKVVTILEGELVDRMLVIVHGSATTPMA